MKWRFPWFFGHGTAGQRWLESELVVLDLELTGLNPARHEIVSAAWVIIKRGKIVLSESRYMLNADVQSLAQSPVYHGIDEEQLKRGASLEEVMNTLAGVLKGKVLVCHNTQLDWSFIQTHARKFGLEIRPDYMLDTLKIEKSRLLRQRQEVGQDQLRLPACRRRYGLPDYQNHNALSDSLATAELLLAQVNHLDAEKHIKLSALM
ncbi:3'-5' exonuclease [Pseudoalteromonas luteoviolacea]|uniref:Exonuclease domain-containing protein n=1 Tax=Pseudoalteromonas luteoviolacea S4060-1 TaxID=1365257 RepID=A0A162BSZ1_9GAMM|nr:3'-5' exonuclease [Pseudoalteromonas luteoviolacea]KZN67921.1 hypothetical protein N478_16995 [Pseudoalteromonas luteoviolacea S4060-1]